MNDKNLCSSTMQHIAEWLYYSDVVQDDFIEVILLSTGTTKKVHEVQSLSLAVEDGEDDGRPWISHKSGDTKSRKESKELPSVHSL